MFPWSGEPFVFCPFYVLLCCVFLVFLQEDRSLGYQCWLRIVGIRALRANRIKTLLCFSFIPAGAQGTQLDRFLAANSSGCYHCMELCDFPLLCTFQVPLQQISAFLLPAASAEKREVELRFGAGFPALLHRRQHRWICCQPHAAAAHHGAEHAQPVSCEQGVRVTADTVNAWEL